MKNLFKFLFLILSFSIFGIGIPKASAQPCTNINLVAGSGEIVLVGGTYYYTIDVVNSGPTITSAVNITIGTNAFGVDDLPAQSINGGGLTTTLYFPINTNIATITAAGFGVPTTLTFPSGTPAPCSEGPDATNIIYTTGWGCTDITAINYDPSATFDNNSCLESICDLLSINATSVQIVYSSLSGLPVLELTVVNNSPFNLPLGTTATPNLTGAIPAFTITNGASYDLSMIAGGYTTLQFPITSPLSTLVGPALLITGSFNVDVPSLSDNCDIEFTNFPIDISNLGCMDVTAFNYDQYATVDNSSCVNDIVVIQSIVQPICQGDAGDLSLDFTGGTEDYDVDYGLQDPENLLPGNYTFTVTDETPANIGGPIVKTFNVSIEYPPLFEVQIAFDGVTTLEAWVNSNFSGWYYWLLDGVVVDSTQVPTYVYTTPGTYTCFVETFENALGQQCWDYSNGIVLTEVGTEEYNNKGLVLYPNPSKGTFSVTLENYDSEHIEAQIFDIQGRVIHNLVSDNFNGQLIFNDLNLNTGLYHIRIENGSDLYRSKIVIE